MALFVVPFLLVLVPSHFFACTGVQEIRPIRVLLIAGVTDVLLAVFFLLLLLREVVNSDEEDDGDETKPYDAKLEHLVVPYLCLAPIVLTAHVMIIRWFVARELMGGEQGSSLVLELFLVLLLPLLFTRKNKLLSICYLFSICIACIVPLIPWFTGSWFIFGC